MSRNRNNNRPRPSTRNDAAQTDSALEGVIQLASQERKDELAVMLADRETLFYIDEQAYTIPRETPPAWGMRVHAVSLQYGESVGMDLALQLMLGAEGYAALSACDTLKPEDVKRMFEIIAKRVLPEGSPFPKASWTGGTTGSQDSPGTSTT